MHIAFIMERCPQFGKVSILCKDVRIMQRCPKYVDSSNVCH